MEHEAETPVAKKALRASMLARRRSISRDARIRMDSAIAGHLVSLHDVIDASHIHLYLSISALAEVDTALVVERLSAMDKVLSVPVLRNGDIFSALYHQGDVVRVAQFGIPEPEKISLVEESAIDIVLLPLLAFDERGYRLGYGKGFYDRFLQRLSDKGVNPFRIGLSYRHQRVDKLPVDCWDEPLHAVVHEDGIIRYT